MHQNVTMQPCRTRAASSSGVVPAACYSSALVVRRRVVLAAAGSGLSLVKADDSRYAARAPAAAAAVAEAATTNNAAAGSQVPSQQSSAAESTPDQRPGPKFNWYKQWYPVAIIDQLDPAVPSKVQLLGMDLVLWRDKNQQWRCEPTYNVTYRKRTSATDRSLWCSLLHIDISRIHHAQPPTLITPICSTISFQFRSVKHVPTDAVAHPRRWQQTNM